MSLNNLVISNSRRSVVVPVIQNGDPLRLVIWKLMQDYGWYSAHDIYLLIKEYGFSKARAYSAMSSFSSKNNWFHVNQRPSTSVHGRAQILIYQIKKEIPKPPIITTDVNTTAKVNGEKLIINLTSKSQKRVQSINNTNKKDKDTSGFVQITITVKGKVFTKAELLSIKRSICEYISKL